MPQRRKAGSSAKNRWENKSTHDEEKCSNVSEPRTSNIETSFKDKQTESYLLQEGVVPSPILVSKIFGSTHQGDKTFKVSGLQCGIMSLTFLVKLHVHNPRTWESCTIDQILKVGDMLCFDYFERKAKHSTHAYGCRASKRDSGFSKKFQDWAGRRNVWNIARPKLATRPCFRL